MCLRLLLCTEGRRSHFGILSLTGKCVAGQRTGWHVCVWYSSSSKPWLRSASIDEARGPGIHPEAKKEKLDWHMQGVCVLYCICARCLSLFCFFASFGCREPFLAVRGEEEKSSAKRRWRAAADKGSLLDGGHLPRRPILSWLFAREVIHVGTAAKRRG